MIEEHAVPLAPRTTLRLGGPARRLVRVESEADVHDALQGASRRGEEVLVLGGGSNLVVGDAGFEGTVVEVALRGFDVQRQGDRARVDVGAGEPWDAFVARCASEGLSGVEALSGIPGLTGATPIQNVGAYGQEVSDTIVSVRAFNRETRRLRDLHPDECLFGYRSSVFRGSSRYVVTRVSYELARDRDSAPLRYAELCRALGVAEGGRAPLSRVRETVVALRGAKGMVLDPDDPDSVSAGSFFVNPTLGPDALAIVDARVAQANVLRPGETMPRFPAAGGRTKLSAGWLIERAGFRKGYGDGRVGVSRKHALALVHRGGGTTAELLALARTIRQGVLARFGVALSPEPVLVGCAFEE